MRTKNYYSLFDQPNVQFTVQSRYYDKNLLVFSIVITYKTKTAFDATNCISKIKSAKICFKPTKKIRALWKNFINYWCSGDFPRK